MNAVRVRLAKADKNRAIAHPLVAGFPIAAALRHLANDPDNSPDLRQTAFIALTGRKGDHISPEGHPEALWALHDQLQEHQNKDGTTGHPLKDVYNWLSAADKIVLDSHTKRALEEAAEDTRRRTPGNHHVGNDPRYGYQWRFRPEHHATMAAAALSAGTDAPWSTRGDDGVADDAVLARVRARVQQLSPHSEEKDIDESIRRHHYRAKYLWNKEHGVGTSRHDAAAIQPVEKGKGEFNKDEVATRYRRRRRYSAIVAGLRRYSGETTEEDFHRLLDANPDDHHTRLVFADWLQERGDPRAEGYRALGMLRKFPRTRVNYQGPSHAWTRDENELRLNELVNSDPHGPNYLVGPSHGLPVDWFHEVARRQTWWSDHNSRREADDKAAIGFSKLHPERRAEILNQPQQLSRRKYAQPRNDFLDALRRSRSSQMNALKRAAQVVAQRLGFHPVSVHDSLHDGPGGAVAGITQAIYGSGRPEQVHEVASWLGLQANSPGVAVFHPRPTGPDLLHRIRVHGSGFELREKLTRAGIANRVLMPHRAGFDVLIPDPGGKLARTTAAFARTNKSELQTSPGHFKIIGNADRSDARATYRDTVARSEHMARKRDTDPRAREELRSWIQSIRASQHRKVDDPTYSLGYRHEIGAPDSTALGAFADWIREVSGNPADPRATVVQNHDENPKWRETRAHLMDGAYRYDVGDYHERPRGVYATPNLRRSGGLSLSAVSEGAIRPRGPATHGHVRWEVALPPQRDSTGRAKPGRRTEFHEFHAILEPNQLHDLIDQLPVEHQQSWRDYANRFGLKDTRGQAEPTQLRRKRRVARCPR